LLRGPGGQQLPGELDPDRAQHAEAQRVLGCRGMAAGSFRRALRSYVRPRVRRGPHEVRGAADAVWGPGGTCCLELHGGQAGGRCPRLG
jgi:hypothetical protein